MNAPAPSEPRAAKPGIVRNICQGVLLGAALLAVLALLMPPGPLTPWRMVAPIGGEPVLSAPRDPAPEFGDANPSNDARVLAHWIARTGDNAGMPFVLIDKRAARLYAFDAHARVQDTTPVLLGSAPGDDSVPGIGDRPIAEVRPEERTTPAGRFVGRFGRTLTGEDVVWVDYDAAVSIHRVRPTLQPKEQRAERLDSATIDDNRISYGCINVPAAFYDTHIRPVFSTIPAVVYVLPEQKSLQQVFGLS